MRGIEGSFERGVAVTNIGRGKERKKEKKEGLRLPTLAYVGALMLLLLPLFLLLLLILREEIPQDVARV